MAKKETWRDWAAPNAPEPKFLLTRDELLQAVRKRLKVTPRTIFYWQQAGVIPYAEVRRIGMAGYAYYPSWMLSLIEELRRLQAEGATLEEIRPRIRSIAADLSEQREVTATIRSGGAESGGSPVVGTVHAPADDPRIAELAEALVRAYEETGPPIARAEIRLFDRRGNPHLLSFTFAESAKTR